MVAWEFCYQKANTASVTFYPGIWRINGTRGININFELVQLSWVTYNSSVNHVAMYACHNFSLAETDQFTAPAGSVIGLYSNCGTQLLRTDTKLNGLRIYQFSGNQSDVWTAGNSNQFDYNVSIRVHLSKYLI